VRTILAVVAIAFVATAAASASRTPTAAEYAAVKRLVLVDLERENPVLAARILAVRVSTQPTGAASPYAKVAHASFTALDEAGNQLDSAYGLLGYSRRYRVWVLLGYGTSRVGCDRRQAGWFGGRRTAIFRDLRVTCGR
jgi:hypothetical protein